MTTTQKIAQLKDLATDAKSNFFARVKLAAEIMSDRDWIAATFSDSVLRAHDYLEATGFPFLGGTLTLGQLLVAYSHFPSEDDWESRNYNVQIMLDEITEIEKPSREPKDRVSWKDKYAKAEEEIALLKSQLQTAERRIAALEGELKGIREALPQLAAAEA